MHTIVSIVAAAAGLVALGAAQPPVCAPGLIIDHCNTAVSGLECYEPPFLPSAFGSMGTFPTEAVVNALAWDGAEGLWVGGQGSGSGVDGRQLYNSTNGGESVEADVRPPGAINALAYGPAGLLVGSWYQRQQDQGNPEASFAQFRAAGSGSWTAASLVGFADHLKSVTVNERGAFHQNGTYYVVAISTYEIVPPTPDDPWSECLLGKTRDEGATWEWSRFPVPENKGVFEVHFFNDSHGIAIGGVHYSAGVTDYLAYILVTEDGGASWEYVFEDSGRFTFTDINCVGTTCWVSGLGVGATGSQHIGLVWRSDNMGRNWRPQLTITDSATSYAHLWHVHFVDTLRGFAQGDYWAGILVIYVTEDGGVTWKVAFEPTCAVRHYVHDMYDVDGTLHMLLQEVDAPMQTGIMRLDYPSLTLA